MFHDIVCAKASGQGLCDFHFFLQGISTLIHVFFHACNFSKDVVDPINRRFHETRVGRQRWSHDLFGDRGRVTSFGSHCACDTSELLLVCQAFTPARARVTHSRSVNVFGRTSREICRLERRNKRYRRSTSKSAISTEDEKKIRALETEDSELWMKMRQRRFRFLKRLENNFPGHCVKI